MQLRLDKYSNEFASRFAFLRNPAFILLDLCQWLIHRVYTIGVTV
jgi:hypothetical protein